MIEVENLSKQFIVHKKKPGLMASIRSLFIREKVIKEAVKSVSFHVGEGEILGLIGENGAGKTTLIKMLAGIIHPTAGDAKVLGFRPWERNNEFRRQIALIMGQKQQLWWDLPAGDCFLLLKEIYRVPDKQFHDTLDYLTDLLQVRDEIDIQIRRLSLGERMKMELIAALLHSPRIVYLDEPTIGLDLTAQRAIRDFILQYREERKPAMIVTSHYMEDIKRLCKRIIIMREGEFVYDGSLSEIVETFADHKVLTAHFREDSKNNRREEDFLPFGKVSQLTQASVQLQVPRKEVTTAAAELLRRFPVVDLTIEEVDIGVIIQRIFEEKSRTLQDATKE